MTRLIECADDILRRRGWAARPVESGRALVRLAAAVLGFGMLYGTAMGVFGGVLGDRKWQVLYSAVKVPFLLLVTFLIGLPSFLVLNTLFGLRRDWGEAVRAVLAAQAGLAIVLAALAPFTLLWYASSADYEAALLFNGLMFAVASLAGQWLLRGYYRPLIQRNPRHRGMLALWLGIYVFIGIQMAWLLRPFVGDPGLPVQFFRHEGFGNAYEVVARLIYDAVAR